VYYTIHPPSSSIHKNYSIISHAKQTASQIASN